MHNTLISELESLQPTALDAGLIFSGKASGRLIQGYARPTAYTPAIDHSYLFHEASRDIIVWLMNAADPLYVFGPTGCGKTSCIKQLAARLNYPVFEVTGHGRLEFADLTGHLAVKDGSMVYEYGPLALAMRYGGMLLLNEIDLTSPEVAAGLNSVLDGSPLCIAENGGELIAPHPMFRFAATANTNGGGDDTGLYQGTQRQNLAWLDRFMLCEVGYPKPDVEKMLLAERFPVLPEELTHKLVDFAGEVRKLFMGEGDGQNLSGAIEVTLSTRTLLRWAELTVRFQPLAHQGIQPVTYALDRALGYRASRETRAMLHELAHRVFPQNWPQDWSQGEDFAASYTTSTSEADDITTIRQGLHPLLGADIAAFATPPFIHLDKASNNSSGGKFWGATVTPQGLVLNWGRANTVGQRVTVDTAQCVNRDPIEEMLNRSIKKLREGYALNPNSTFIPKENV